MEVRANEYAPPAWGNAGDISAIEKQRPMYIAVIASVARIMPPKPPEARPKFHPKQSPEMTAPTPIPLGWHASQRHTQANRPITLIHPDRQHAVLPDGRDQQRDTREDSEQRGVEPRLRGIVRHPFLHGANVGERQLGIEVVNLPARGG